MKLLNFLEDKKDVIQKNSQESEKGVALIFSLFVMIFFAVFSAGLIQASITAMNSSRRALLDIETEYIAEGSVHAAIEQVNTFITSTLPTYVGATNTEVVRNSAQSYYATNNGLGFLAEYLVEGVTPQLVLDDADNPTTATYSLANQALGNGMYGYTITFIQKSNPTRVDLEHWQFFYDYQIQSTGTRDAISKQDTVSGDFTLDVQTNNLSRYSIAIDSADWPSGSQVWFTGGELDGPAHANNDFKFAFSPSTNFVDQVTQGSQNATFFNNWNPITLNADSNPPIDVPSFESGYLREAPTIDFATTTQPKDNIISQSLASATAENNGIYLPNNGTSLTGGIYVKGDAALNMSVDGNNNAIYTIVQGGTTKTVTVDITNNQTTIVSGGSTEVYQGLPNGVDSIGTIVEVDGDITSFSGTIQEDTQITVASTGDIMIDNHVLYSDYTPGQIVDSIYTPPSAEGTNNILGMVSWNGSVQIAASAPNDLFLHGIVMSSQSYSSVTEEIMTWQTTGNATDLLNAGNKGLLTHLGGHIGTYLGAWGAFDQYGNVYGYNSDIVYDKRVEEILRPPYFPTMGTFTITANNLKDRLIW